MAGCSQLDAIVALGKNSKNLTDAAIKASSAAIALAALSSLVRDGSVDAKVYKKAEKNFGVSTERNDITEL